MTFQFNDKPFFDPKGNLYVPNSLPFGGELKPSLTPREWLCWLLDNALNTPKRAYKNLVGNATTRWRIRKKLKEKGYQ